MTVAPRKVPGERVLCVVFFQKDWSLSQPAITRLLRNLQEHQSSEVVWSGLLDVRPYPAFVRLHRLGILEPSTRSTTIRIVSSRAEQRLQDRVRQEPVNNIRWIITFITPDPSEHRLPQLRVQKRPVTVDKWWPVEHFR